MMMSDIQLVVVTGWRPFGLASDKLKHVGHKATKVDPMVALRSE